MSVISVEDVLTAVLHHLREGTEKDEQLADGTPELQASSFKTAMYK